MANNLITLYQANDLQMAEMIHQRLSAQGIDAFVEPTASPLDGLTTLNQGPHVVVREEDAVRARAIIEEFLAERSA